jgi:hypothetical protein
LSSIFALSSSIKDPFGFRLAHNGGSLCRVDLYIYTVSKKKQGQKFKLAKTVTCVR